VTADLGWVRLQDLHVALAQTLPQQALVIEHLHLVSHAHLDGLAGNGGEPAGLCELGQVLA